jgi:anti-sigma B factor antagonist
VVREESVSGCGCEHDALLSVRIDGGGDGAVALRLRGELDSYTAARVAGALRKALLAGHAVVVVDLAGVEFLGARGLEVFAHAAAEYDLANATLVFTGLSDRIRRLFRLSGLDRILRVEE